MPVSRPKASDKRSAASGRDYRIVRGCFAAFFLGLTLLILWRYELNGWPLLILGLSAVSVVINLVQAITGPSNIDDKDNSAT
jgi:hypothetical protein